MKIEYNETEKTIEIKDGLKNQYLILKILMILNLTNVLIRIFGKNTTEYGFIEYFWIGLGLISLIILVMFIFKMSTAGKISIAEIKRLEEKTVFGQKRFALKLKNGRKRNLGNFKDQFELAKARELFTEIGIQRKFAVFRLRWKEYCGFFRNEIIADTVSTYFKKDTIRLLTNNLINKNRMISMKANLIKTFLLLTISILLTNCATQRTSTIVGGDYNETKNETDYFVLPYGAVTLPGKWEKTNYNTISRQQFFRNQDSVIIAIAFGRFNKYEFNTDGSKTGYNFVKAYYEWDSKYFVDSHGLKRQPLENDSTNNFMIYRILGQIEKGEFDTYFLIGEKNGNTSNFSISDTDKWTENEKIDFLKNLYLTKKEE